MKDFMHKYKVIKCTILDGISINLYNLSLVSTIWHILGQNTGTNLQKTLIH